MMHFLCLATILAMADAPSPAHLTVAKNLPIAPVAEEPHGRNGIILIVGLIAAVAMSSVLIVATYYLHMIHKHQEKPFGDDNDDKDDDDEENGVSQGFQKSATQHMLPAMHVSSNEAQVFTYKQLQFATSNFSPTNLLSSPRRWWQSGAIYRGILPNGNVSIIKQLFEREGEGCKQIDREFRMEVDLLSRVHSPYLLELIGYCADKGHRLLVYEYMANGSLQQHLYSDACTNANLPTLDWGTRLRIALDAARGLEYLHEFMYPPIIHRDFKSSNVLLTADFNAKIADFGLAKLGSDKMNGQVFTRVLGTQGYVAPEYALTGQLTTKSDVYSFGIVLLELLTGRTPVDMERPSGEGVLLSWALPLLTNRHRVHEVVDPVLNGQYPMKDLIQVAAIATMCVQSEADYRPLMTDVVQSLVPLVKKQWSHSKGHSGNLMKEAPLLRASSLR